MWRVTGGAARPCSLRSISIHTLRVEGDATPATYEEGGETISIHTLRVEGDPTATVPKSKLTISIHTLRVEGDDVLPHIHLL